MDLTLVQQEQVITLICISKGLARVEDLSEGHRTQGRIPLLKWKRPEKGITGEGGKRAEEVWAGEARGDRELGRCPEVRGLMGKAAESVAVAQ